jgi:hypothetical protein
VEDLTKQEKENVEKRDIIMGSLPYLGLMNRNLHGILSKYKK